ncbi:ribonuclease P protein component [Roseospira visakhapatnamensis]|uniref:Ribonuclease P protein component n=1 Tax=Roseospira visakhapatnamensis TaxID=390880 RepID=A0A7W6WBI4_9PROT|nr:ribonuclease P protein component [Roseospira visakhapatnamensis]MBB4267546.1 ribonuclease P protein component [Roseospira visakhapatnamensis]
MDDAPPVIETSGTPPSPPRGVPRLKRRGDFLRVAGHGRKWVTPGFILQAAPQSGAAATPGAPARVGFTVSRKVGKAVVRNRARRRLRAAVDLVFPDSAHAGWDFVLIGRRETNDRLFDALVRDLRTALTRLDPARPGAGGGGRKGGDKGRGPRRRGRTASPSAPPPSRDPPA